MVEWCTGKSKIGEEEGGGKTYYSTETSDPAKAKSQSWVLQRDGRPEKQPVRYSTQLGPPADVPICESCDEQFITAVVCGAYQFMEKMAYLALYYFIGKELMRSIVEILKIADERVILSTCCPLNIRVTITKSQAISCQPV